MAEHEFWRDTTTGHVWAVEIEDGVVSGCCGPLDWSEVDDDFLGTFDYLPDYASWVEANRELFALLETRYTG